MQHRGCEAGLKHRGWVCAFGLVLFGRSFRGSCFWSFFGFVLLVVLFVVRSSGSCFLGARMCFLFAALKVLEACVARSEVS